LDIQALALSDILRLKLFSGEVVEAVLPPPVPVAEGILLELPLQTVQVTAA